MRWILSIVLLAATLFLLSCVPAEDEGVAITLLDSDGNVVMREAYASTAVLDTQALTVPEDRKRRAFSRDFRRAMRNEAKQFQTARQSEPNLDPPQLRIEYEVTNTGDIPIRVNVDARVKGFFFKGGDNNG